MSVSSQRDQVRFIDSGGNPRLALCSKASRIRQTCSGKDKYDGS
jgi:hypothetical protein